MRESGPELAGGRLGAWRLRSQLNGHKACNTITTNRVSGPPVGEASARSVLRYASGPSSGKGLVALASLTAEQVECI